MPDEPADPERPSIGPALQLKVRLLQVSPMVWRRLLVPAATTLRELQRLSGSELMPAAGKARQGPL